jgi:hypothetical protein
MDTKRNRLHYIPTHLLEKKKNLKKRKEKSFIEMRMSAICCNIYV